MKRRIIITVDHELTPQVYQKLEKRAKKVFPNNEILILEGGAHIQVVDAD